MRGTWKDYAYYIRYWLIIYDKNVQHSQSLSYTKETPIPIVYEQTTCEIQGINCNILSLDTRKNILTILILLYIVEHYRCCYSELHGIGKE